MRRAETIYRNALRRAAGERITGDGRIYLTFDAEEAVFCTISGDGKRFSVRFASGRGAPVTKETARAAYRREDSGAALYKWEEHTMKIRESGMPDEPYWESFFNPLCIARKMGADASCGDAVKFGCGYGTFTVAVASAISGTLYALDIDPNMIAATKQRVSDAGVNNVQVVRRDVTAGSGLADGVCDLALLFNILHCEEPVALLREAYRNLRAGGSVALIHWINDPATPRGPSLAIRPTPLQCRLWAEEAGFVFEREETFLCCAYHWGLILRRPL